MTPEDQQLIAALGAATYLDAIEQIVLVTGYGMYILTETSIYVPLLNSIYQTRSKTSEALRLCIYNGVGEYY